MRKKIIRSPMAPDPIGPYSQAVATEAQRLVFFSGQIGLGPGGFLVGEEDVEAQTHQVMKNLEAVLDSAGMNWDNVIKTTIFLTDLDWFPTVNAVYARYFAERLPARSTVEVSRLPGGASVEIELIAAS